MGLAGLCSTLNRQERHACRHEWAAKEKAKEEEKAKQEAAALAAEEAALEEAEMNAPAGVHFGALPATRTGGGSQSADPAGAVAGDLSTSAAGLQQASAAAVHAKTSTKQKSWRCTP